VSVDEPWQASDAPLAAHVVPDGVTRAALRCAAHAYSGVSALSMPAPPPPLAVFARHGLRVRAPVRADACITLLTSTC
jgi:hypothetical protein